MPINRRTLNFVEIFLLCATPLIYTALSFRATNPDPFVYAQAAKQVLAGHRLYDGAWQDKPPLGILFFAVPQIFVARSYAAIFFFLGLCLVAQAVMVRWAFRDHRPAAFFAVLFVLLFPMTDTQYAWPSTEHFGNLFVMINVVLAYTIFRSRRFTLGQCVLAGVATCLAFHVRQNILLSGLLPAMGVICSELPWPKKLTGLATLAAAGMACWGLILGGMCLWGDIRGYWYICFDYPRAYARFGRSSDVWRLLRLPFKSGPIPVLSIVAIILAIATPYRRLIAALFAVGVVSCVLPKRPYPHYWANFFPFLAIAAGIGLAHSRWATTKVVRALTIVLALTVGYASAIQVRRAIRDRSFQTYAQIAADADAAAPAGATLFVCGQDTSEAIAFASRLPPANLFSTAFQLTWPWSEMLPKPIGTIFDEYLEHPPGVMVLGDSVYQSVQAANTPADVAKLENDRKLTRLLMDRYPYVLARHDHGYTILLIRTSVTSLMKSYGG